MKIFIAATFFLVALTCHAGTSTTPKQEQYLEAAAVGLTDRVQEMLASGVLVDSQTNKGETAFELAAMNGQVHIMKILLDKGADLNHVDNQGETPLTTAIIRNQTDTVQFLVDHHAVLDVPGKVPSLSIAVASKQYDIAKLLLDHGASPEIPPRTETLLVQNPLGLAIFAQDPKMVKILIDYGANVNRKSWLGKSPLFQCTMSGPQGDGPDIAAIAQMLLDKGANKNYRLPDGKTPLIAAAEAGMPRLSELLVAQGADVTLADRRGETAIMKAIKFESAEFAIPKTKNKRELSQFLLKHSADPRQAAEASLIVSIQGTSLQGVTDAIAHGADVNKARLEGISPIVAAVETLSDQDPYNLYSHGYKNAQAILHLLIADGARVAQPDSNGTTAVAVVSRNDALTKYLISLGADPKQAVAGQLMQPLERNYLLGVTQLLKSKIDFNTRNEQGKTPLMLAVSVTDPKVTPIIERMLALGADPNATDSDGLSPLGMVNLPQVASLLIAHGADVNQHVNGVTPLFSALNRNAMELVPILLKAKCDVTMQDGLGYTALDYARAFMETSAVNQIEAYQRAQKTSTNDALPLTIIE